MVKYRVRKKRKREKDRLLKFNDTKTRVFYYFLFKHG